MVWRTISSCLDALKGYVGSVTQAVSRDSVEAYYFTNSICNFLHVVREHSLLLVPLFFVPERGSGTGLTSAIPAGIKVAVGE